MTRRREKQERGTEQKPAAPVPDTPEKPTYRVDRVSCNKSLSTMAEYVNHTGIEEVLNRRSREGYVLDRLVLLRNSDVLVVSRKNKSK